MMMMTTMMIARITFLLYLSLERTAAVLQISISNSYHPAVCRSALTSILFAWLNRNVSTICSHPHISVHVQCI
jgi:hypothetical protein